MSWQRSWWGARMPFEFAPSLPLFIVAVSFKIHPWLIHSVSYSLTVMKNLPIRTLIASGLLLTPLAQASIALNFAAISNPLFGTAGNLTQQYATVAPGINATMTAATPFTSPNPVNNGSVLGDIRVNAAPATNVNITISLWDASSGTGYNNPYNPGGSYSFAFGFFDIDGGFDSYDVVTVYTPGTYTVTSSTALLITTGAGVSFSGSASGEVPGQGGITTLTAAQAHVAAIYTVTNNSSINFDYAVGLAGPTPNVRNLLVDGNDLTESLAPFGLVTETFIPEPSAILLGMLSTSLFSLRRKRSSGVNFRTS